MLVAQFEREGWSVWWDPIIPPGKRWDDVVEEALQAAKCVVVAWTPNSVTSEWVRTEAADAKARGVLVPVILQSVALPLEFRRIEACNLSEWHPGDASSEFELLLSAIRNLVNTQDVEPPSSALASASSGASKRNQSHRGVIGIVVGLAVTLAVAIFGYLGLTDKTAKSETGRSTADTVSQQSSAEIGTAAPNGPASTSSAARPNVGPAQELTLAVWRKNWLTVNEPVHWMGSSDGTRAANREEFDELLTKLDLKEVPAVARKRDSLLRSLRDAPARPGDPIYNVAVPSDFDAEFRSLKRAVRDLALDAGVGISEIESREHR